ncbi:MAG: hypothetical protein RIS45_67 [Planctomycetota bacterium]|jgi:hypothetical protein
MSLQDVFGGSDSQSLLNPRQSQFMRSIYNRVNRSIQDGNPQYQGQTIAGINPTMQNAFAAYPGAINLNPGVDAALNAQLAGAGDPAGVQAMYESALGPARQEFDRALGQVGARYGDVWGRSGAHPEMIGRTTAEYGMGLNNLLANLTYNDRQQAADRQAAAIPMALGVRASNADAIQSLFGMGQQQRAIEQQRLTGDFNAWNAQQWYNNPAIPLGQSMLGIQTHGYVNEPGWFNQAVGAGQGLANFGLALSRPI